MLRYVCSGLTALCLVWCARNAAAQFPARGFLALSESFYKSGDAMLPAFAPVVSTARNSLVRFDLDDKPATLGVVVDRSGLVITKASELKEGKLTARLADGRTVEVIESVADVRNDVALVRLKAADLKPIVWSEAAVAIGQWAVTPGLGQKPEAVGVISAAMRKLHKRALIGVTWDQTATNAKIATLMPNFGAAAAGLKSGDVILAVNGTAVKDGEALRNTLQEFREGQTVQLHVQRDEQEFDVSVEMKPESAIVSPFLGRGNSREARMNRFGGELSQRAGDFDLVLQHDTVLQPWECGGPLLNLEGKAVGLNIARAGRIASYALPASLVKRLVEELKSQPMKPLNGVEKQEPAAAPDKP